MGKTDKLIRLVIVIAIALLNYFEVVPRPFSYVLLGVAIILLVTSFLNFCPIYSIFGMHTCSLEEKGKE